MMPASTQGMFCTMGLQRLAPKRAFAWAFLLLAILATTCRADPGDMLWSTPMAGTLPGQNSPAGLVIDSHNAIYVAGQTYTYTGGYDIAVAKYTSRGVLVWKRTYNGPANLDDWATGIAIDSLNNIIVTGISLSGSLAQEDVVTIKWSSAGRQLWARRWDGPAHGDDGSCGVAVDAFNQIVVAGWTWKGGTSGYDALTLKYDSFGNLRWAQTYNGPASGDDTATAITVDRLGSVCVTGYSWGGLQSLMDVVTLKYDQFGKLQWARRYDGPGSDWDVPSAIGTDAAGDVYVTGSSTAPNGLANFVTLKYDTNGHANWVNTYNGGSSGFDQANAMQVKPDGTAYVTGYSSAGTDTSGNWLGSIVTLQYLPSGAVGWTNSYSPSQEGYAAPTSLAVDTLGEVYVSGAQQDFATGAAASLDFVTCKIDPTGNLVWATPLAGASGMDANTTAMALNRSNYVIVAGQVQTAWDRLGFAQYEWMTACFSP